MTENHELNKKLAEWAGFKLEIVPHGFEFWEAPDGRKELPSFTESLDTCFKWLVPKLREIVDMEEVSFTCEDDGILALVCYWLHTGNKEADNYLAIEEGKAKTPALAFCKAIEKLIDKEAG